MIDWINYKTIHKPAMQSSLLLRIFLWRWDPSLLRKGDRQQCRSFLGDGKLQVDRLTSQLFGWYKFQMSGRACKASCMLKTRGDLLFEEPKFHLKLTIFYTQKMSSMLVSWFCLYSCSGDQKPTRTGANSCATISIYTLTCPVRAREWESFSQSLVSYRGYYRMSKIIS